MSLRHAVIRLAHANPSLRPHLLPIITASTWQTLKGPGREAVHDAVWSMYQNTYRTIGMHLTNAHQMLKYDVWDVSFDEAGVPVAFCLYETTPYGRKSILSGHDGSPNGKAQALANMRQKFRQNGVYGEVSHKVKDIAFAAGAPVVCAAYAGPILGKQVEPQDDGISYSRNLPGVGNVTKVMVGSPKGVPTTNAANPSCPMGRVATSVTTSADQDEHDLLAHFACLAM